MVNRPIPAGRAVRAPSLSAALLRFAAARAVVACVVVACVVGFCAIPREALATFDSTHGNTDHTAWTLDRHEWRLGLFQLEYGIHDRLDIGTYTWPWLGKTGSLLLHMEVWRPGDWTVSPRLSLIWLDLAKVSRDGSDLSGRLAVIPLEVLATRRMSESLSWSAGFVYTKVGFEREPAEVDWTAAIGITNLQLLGSAEWRAFPAIALQLHARYLVYQGASANTVYVMHPDDFTTVEVVGTAETDLIDVQNAWSLTPAIALSAWGTNAVLGLGYGNYNLPGLNFVSPVKTPTFLFELYWRWGGDARREERQERRRQRREERGRDD